MKVILRTLVIAVFCGLFATVAAAAEQQKAIFAGGCFWCMEAEFEQQKGVSTVVSGYTGGTVANPTYEQVSSGATGHVEAIEVTFDPSVIAYADLLRIFWENVDPTDPNGQFCDKGTQYRAGIFYADDAQKAAAETSAAATEKKLGQKIVTFVRKAEPFYPAEEHHQDYSQKEKLRYSLYRQACGRDAQLEKLGLKAKE